MYKSMCEEEGGERRGGSGAWGVREQGSRCCGAGTAEGLAGVCVCVSLSVCVFVHTRVHVCDSCTHRHLLLELSELWVPSVRTGQEV